MTLMRDDDVTVTAAPVEAPAQVVSRGRLVLRRFRRRRLAVGGLAVIVVLYLMAFVAPVFAPWSYDDLDYSAFLSEPTPSHWFGTNKIGQDVFAQVMRGLQKSLTIGLLVGVISTSVSAVVGATAGYLGGIANRVLMWATDLLLVLPSFLIIAIASPWFKGANWLVFVALLAAFNWMITARIVRGMTLSLREREFVLAAKFMGQPTWRIIAKHILPNMASLLIVDATINVGVAVLTETSLSFFGFGVQPPDVSLGTLIAAGTGSATTYPWLFLAPAGFLVLFVLAVNLAGDGLRDAIDPSSGGGR